MLPKLGGNTRRLCSQRLFWLNFWTKKKKKVGLEADKEKEWKGMGDFPGGPMVKNHLPIQGTRVPSLIRENHTHRRAVSPQATTAEAYTQQ